MITFLKSNHGKYSTSSFSILTSNLSMPIGGIFSRITFLKSVGSTDQNALKSARVFSLFV